MSQNVQADNATALITMGGQAQVVTFALDALLNVGERIATVLVLHLSPQDPRVQSALAQLSAEFAGEDYQGRHIVFRHFPVQIGDYPLSAVRDANDAEATWSFARNLLTELKQAGQALHLCIAGGPRLLALTLTSAALLQCDHRDRLWHLYTPREFVDQARDGAILHAPAEAGVRLVPVPMAPWGAYFPALKALSRPAGSFPPPPDPADAARCAAVWKQLTGRQRDVLRALAEGQSLQETAETLCVTVKTVHAHKTAILDECRNAWELPQHARLDYHFLREKFGPYFQVIDV